MSSTIPLWVGLTGWLVAAWLALELRSLQRRHDHAAKWARTWRDEAMATAEQNGDLTCRLANLEHSHANLQELYAALMLHRLAMGSLRLLPWMVAKGKGDT